MTDKKEKTEEKETEQEEEAPTTAESKKTEEGEKPHMIPKTRLDEEITKRKELKGRLDAIEVANKEAEEQRLKDNEEFKKLAEKKSAEVESLKPKADIADAQEATLSTYLAAQIEELPEDVRDMVPENYSTMDKLDWLAKNKAKLMKPVAPDIVGKQGGSNGKVVALTPEQKDAASKMKVSEKDYAKNL